MSSDDGKDIAVLKTKVQIMGKDVSKLQTDVASIKDDTTKILEQILVLPQHYLLISAFNTYREEVKTELLKTGRRSKTQNTITAALGIIFGAVATAASAAIIEGKVH